MALPNIIIDGHGEIPESLSLIDSVVLGRGRRFLGVPGSLGPGFE